MNKPVAWMLVDEINGDYMLERHPSGDYDWIPLYTHPVRELTQQEIDKIENSVYLKTIAKGKPIGSYGQELVKAILRKAQDK